MPMWLLADMDTCHFPLQVQDLLVSLAQQTGSLTIAIECSVVEHM